VRGVDADEPRVAAGLRAWMAPAAASPGGAAASCGEPGVTVLIPANRYAPRGVTSLLAQDVPVEVVVLSNGSGPQTVPGARTVQVPWRGHGATRQHAIHEVKTPYVLLTVDDAIPMGAGFLRQMVVGLEAGQWDAVIARQVPWPDADAISRARLRSWTPPALGGASSAATAGVIEARQLDHVCALFKTETLLGAPLPDVPIAEDAWWGRGRRIGLVVGAPVLHSHERHALPLFRRERAIHAERARMGEAPTVSDLPTALWGALGAVRLGPREVIRHSAEVVGQWAGARDGARAIPRPTD
jgi:hypothetical protein